MLRDRTARKVRNDAIYPLALTALWGENAAVEFPLRKVNCLEHSSHVLPVTIGLIFDDCLAPVFEMNRFV